jgi:hypothetical protein
MKLRVAVSERVITTQNQLDSTWNSIVHAQNQERGFRSVAKEQSNGIRKTNGMRAVDVIAFITLADETPYILPLATDVIYQKLPTKADYNHQPKCHLRDSAIGLISELFLPLYHNTAKPLDFPYQKYASRKARNVGEVVQIASISTVLWERMIMMQ